MDVSKVRDIFGAFHIILLPVLQVTAQCDRGWAHHGEKCYFFSDEKKNFIGSKGSCSGDYGAILACPSNADINDLISENIDESYWIGLDVSDSWLWIDGTSVTYENWNPDERSGSFPCTLMNTAGTWEEAKCSKENIFVCEKDTDGLASCPEDWTNKNDRCYYISTDQMTQQESIIACSELGASLAVIEDEDENSVVLKRISKSAGSENAWIGLTRYTWLDGSIYDWQNWKEDTWTINVCAYIDGPSGKWISSEQCTTKRKYICQKDEGDIKDTSTQPSNTTPFTTQTSVDWVTSQPTELSPEWSTESVTTSETPTQDSPLTSSPSTVSAIYVTATTSSVENYTLAFVGSTESDTSLPSNTTTDNYTTTGTYYEPDHEKTSHVGLPIEEEEVILICAVVGGILVIILVSVTMYVILHSRQKTGHFEPSRDFTFLKTGNTSSSVEGSHYPNYSNSVDNSFNI